MVKWVSLSMSSSRRAPTVADVCDWTGALTKSMKMQCAHGAEGEKDFSLNYGETDMHLVLRLLRAAVAGTWGHISADPLLVDIGSGVGQIIVAAALSLPLRAAVGVELIDGRHQRAGALLAAAQSGDPPIWEGGAKECDEASTKRDAGSLPDHEGVLSGTSVRFIHGDAMDAPVLARWADADLVFVNTMVFSDELLHRCVGCRREARPFIPLPPPSPSPGSRALWFSSPPGRWSSVSMSSLSVSSRHWRGARTLWRPTLGRTRWLGATCSKNASSSTGDARTADLWRPFTTPSLPRWTR